MQNGFLPEPIPVAEVSQSTIDKLSAQYTDALGMPNMNSPVFADMKEKAFLKLCENMSVEQAMARYSEVFTEGLAKSAIAISIDLVREVAKNFGEAATGGIVVDALADPRLFRRWIKDVIVHIAKRHFGASVRIALDVAHLDLPAEEQSWSHLMIYVPSYYDEDEEESVEAIFDIALRWPGRHVIRNVWVDYVGYLLRTICALSV